MVNSLSKSCTIVFIAFCTLLFSCNANKTESFERPNGELLRKIGETTNNKPWTYWWWMGSAVDKKSIDYSVEQFKNAGLGGMHIVPIYGVKGEEEKFLDYLSPEWLEMLAYTKSKCDELGLGLDMTLGTGWCFGGKGIDEQTGSMLANIERVKLPGGQIDINLALDSEYRFNEIQSVLAILADGTRTDISKNVDQDQHLSWSSPHDSITLYILRIQGPVFKVKRPAPGGEGFMLDPFSSFALDTYTARFDTVFNGKLNNYVRSIYHDSYEYKADWTHGFFNIFEDKRGYDLRMYLPELFGESTDFTTRVVADYRQTMSELHEAFTTHTRNWAIDNDLLYRNQGHGSPTNWLDIYALADIPETETFGAKKYEIPGLTREAEFINDDHPNRFVLKFASSAAHVMGKPLISSETNTWLREHFRVALSHSKPELDQLFLSGINHIFYHGIAYSSIEAEWPGWQFYASSSFAPTNSIFHHFYAQNKYVERVQEAMRSGAPDNDILLYYPIQDIWHSPIKLGKLKRHRIDHEVDLRKPLETLYKLTAHNYQDWLVPYPIYRTATKLDSLGYSFDYISDKQLSFSKIKNGQFVTAGNSYKTLVIPDAEYIPLETLIAIKQFAENGGNVIFLEQMPLSVPGFFEFEEREKKLARIKEDISSNENIQLLESASKDALTVALLDIGVTKESFADVGIPYIRRKTENGYLYFVSNIYSGHDVNEHILLGVKANEVIFTNPATGESGKAFVSHNGSVLLQLEQGKSLIIETFNEPKNDVANWKYFGTEGNPIEIRGNWQVDFIKGGPEIPSSYTTNTLISWAENGDTEAERFAGTARYTIEFEIAELKSDEYILEFEKVKESALIKVNGKEVIVLFAHPFKVAIGEYLKQGLNRLEVEVANLAANRIRDLDMRGVNWKKFYDINFVNIDYKPFDASGWELVESGLIGKVQIVPVELIKF